MKKNSTTEHEQLTRSGVALLAPRICVLGHEPCGGSEVVLWEDARIISEMGVPVRVYARAAREGTPAQILRTRTNTRLLTSLEYCGQFLQREPEAILIAYNEPTVAALSPRRALVRFDWYTALPRYWSVPGCFGRFQQARYVFPSTDELQIFSKAHPRIASTSATVLPNAVDVSLFKPAAGRSTTGMCVGFAGQWAERKGIQTLLDAWAIVSGRIPEAQLQLMDGSRLWKAEMLVPGASELDKRIRAMESEGRVIIRAAVPRSQMPEFWTSLSVAVVPSLYEPFGLVALEAMACGIPVIASAVGGLRELIEDGRSGLLVPPNDAPALAEKLISALTDAELRDRLAVAARRRAEQFSLVRREDGLRKLLFERVQRVAEAA